MVKNPNAVALGRLGGLKGGPARAQALTPAERRKSAQRAATASWSLSARVRRDANKARRQSKRTAAQQK